VSKSPTPWLEPLSTASRESVTAEVSRRLLSYLLSGAVKPGGRLPSERKLAEALGVGRTNTREALKSLHLLGILRVRPGDATYLRTTESELLPKVIEWGLLLGEQRAFDVIEARQHLETILAGLAAERRTQEDLAVMRRAYQAMDEAAGDLEALIAADVAFHTRMWEAAGNSVLLEAMTSIRSLQRVWIARTNQPEPDAHRTASEHAAVLEAIERGDAQAAREAMAKDMAVAAERLKATLATAELIGPAGAQVSDPTSAPAAAAVARAAAS
jgi:GntR family transcriptional repressor for pyruvate dehydrogenase complex